ncbi:unnamed protein product [Cylindrotheca closterium]|uniref:HSF-type DNA-binding domain-containing protein n=1 Tax=Cylindrotheca closterium TaxID=2856 RepID=A0AAD2G297_9STRA|nr:unnamed protein product [Cylindrotheca closterium]
MAVKKKGGRVPFPSRLFQLLKLTEDKGWEDIFSWVNDGTGFKVHDREKFEKVLLQKHFNTKRYASFARQLHAYGFDCVRTGRNTGIYSHPAFKRDDPKGSCLLKREETKTISKKAISEHNQAASNISRFSNFHLGIRAGDTVVQFPSLLKPSTQNGEANFGTLTFDNSQPSGPMGNLYNTVRAQVADRTRKALIRIPSEASDNPFSNPDNAFWSPNTNQNTNHNRAVSDTSSISTKSSFISMNNSVSSPKPSGMGAHYNMNMNMNIVDDDMFRQMAMVPEEDDDSFGEDGDFEPIPWSPLPTPFEGDIDSVLPIQLDSSILEPRPINEMVQDPATANTWMYDSVPLLGTPRRRALLEFSLPVSLPIGFYVADVSSYGIYWVCFLILGHFVECLFTSWGGAEDKKDKTYTKDLSIKPTIGMLQHHIMDLLWFHSLLSNMILTPHYFGAPCYALLYLFIWPQPFNLSIAIKTHYCESNLEGTYAHGKWWIGDIVRKVLLGYGFTILGIVLVHVFEMASLRIPLVFGFNMIPLVAFESYRYLLSVSAVAGLTSEARVAKKKVQ